MMCVSHHKSKTIGLSVFLPFVIASSYQDHVVLAKQLLINLSYYTALRYYKTFTMASALSSVTKVVTELATS
jgi:hypothetical protein